MGGRGAVRSGQKSTRESTTGVKILVDLNPQRRSINLRFAEFVRNSGSPVAYYPRLAIALGGVKEAVFVCQLLYWEGKQSDSDRWIHKSLEEVRSETGLSRYEQEGVRRTLEKEGILESRYERLEHRLYFRVNLARLSDCWEAQYPCSEVEKNDDSQVDPDGPWLARRAKFRRTMRDASSEPGCSRDQEQPCPDDDGSDGS